MSNPKGKKGTLKDLINKFVATKINQYLGKYLKDIKQEDLQASIGTNSAITLYNIQLRKDAFDEFRLPVEVHPDSKVKEISCVLRMLPLQVNIIVKGIRAIVMPNFKAWSPEQWKEYKSKSLEEWEETQKHIFENLNLKTYKRQKINMVANNINVTIEDIIVYYRDTMALGTPCVIRLRVEELKMVTTNEDYTREQPSKSEFMTHRKLSIRDFSLAIYCETMPPDSQASFDDIRFSDRMYVVKPCVLNLLHTVHHKASENKPVHVVKLEVTSLVLSINEVQRQFIESLVSNLNNKMQYKNYEENRPIGKVVGQEQEWWNYLIKTCKQDLGISIVGLVKNKQSMDRYIDCYKTCQEIIHAPWLPDKTDEKVKYLLEIEEIFPLEKLIWFRTLALYQLRIEAMSYVKARGNVRGKTHLGDLWDYYLNDFESLLGDPYKTVAEEHEIELTLDEKDELNCLLHMDELNIVDSYLNGTSSSRNDQILDINILIKQFTMFIQETQYTSAFKCSPIPRSVCACSACRGDIFIQQDSVSYNVQREEQKPEKTIQTRDTVFSILMVNHEGKAYDPKLVKERTLLVIEAQLNGAIIVHRDMHLEMHKDFEINNLYMWDPLALQEKPEPEKTEKSEIEKFREKYGFTVANDLLNMILRGRGEEFSLINSLRFFMQDVGLIGELEFIIHCDEIFMKVSHFCSCKKIYPTIQEQKKAFLDPESKYCLHLTSEEMSKYQNSTDLKSLYLKIYEYLNDSVMPRYLRNCVRWIISNTTRIVNGKSNPLMMNLKLKGKSSPIEVQFVDRKKRKSEDGKVTDTVNYSVVKMESEEVSVTFSTETVQSLIKWAASAHVNFEYKKTFISTLVSCSPKLEYVKNIISNSKKSGQQLYYILRDKQKAKDPISISVNIDKIKIKLIENLFNTGRNSLCKSEITFERFKLEIKTIDDKVQARESNSRIDFKRDSKFYVSNSLNIENITIDTNSLPIIHIEDLMVNNKDCIMSGHPYLIENIVDIKATYIKISMRKEILSIFGLISSLDFTPVKHYSKESIIKKNLQKVIFRFDKERIQKELLEYQNEHYRGKELKDCIHCMLNYRKLCKNVNFSIGDPLKQHVGLELLLYSIQNRDRPITLACPKILGIIEERIFNSVLTIYCSNFDKCNELQLKLFKKAEGKFDFNDISPLFLPIAKTATPLITGVAELYQEHAEPLYLLMRIAQRKDSKVFDSDLWKIREELFQKNIFHYIPKKNKIKIPRSMNITNKNINLMIRNKEKYICSDYMKMKLDKIKLKTNESLNSSNLIAVLLSAATISTIYSKYIATLKATILKKLNFINTEITINKLSFICDYKYTKLFIHLKDIKILQFSSFFKCSFNKRDKKEAIENVSLISVRKIHACLEKNAELSLKSVAIIVTDVVNQLKSYNKLKKKFSSSILKKITKNDVNIKSLLLTHTRSKLNLLAIPAYYYQNNYPILDNDSIAMRILYQTKKTEKDLQDSLKLNSSPIGIYAHGKSIIRVLKQFKKLFNSATGVDLEKILSTPKNYIFTNSSQQEPMQLLIEVDIDMISADLLIKSTKLGAYKFSKIAVNNIANQAMLNGKIGLLEILSTNESFPNSILPFKEEVEVSVTLRYSFSENGLYINVDNAQVIFLMKFLEENLSLVTYIQSRLNQLEEHSSKIQINKLEPKNQSSGNVVVIFTNSAILIPKSSNNPESLLVSFKKAQLKTFSNKQCNWKLPVPNQKIEKYDKEISLISQSSTDSITCLKLDIEIQNMVLYLNQSYIGSAAQSEIFIYIPNNPDLGEFLLKNRVEIELSSAKLSISLGKIQQIEQIVNTNMDEPLANGEKKIKTMNTKFKVKVISGALSMFKWITKPLVSLREEAELCEALSIKSWVSSKDSQVSTDKNIRLIKQHSCREPQIIVDESEAVENEFSSQGRLSDSVEKNKLNEEFLSVPNVSGPRRSNIMSYRKDKASPRANSESKSISPLRSSKAPSLQ